MMTNEMWPWKLESSKECVTTHRSNLIAPKMDGAKTINRSMTGVGNYFNQLLVGGREG